MVCQLHFCFPLSASRALTSSCFFACSMSDDTGGQDGLRRGGRPSSAARSIDICRSAATNDSGSSTPRTHQGTCSPPGRADLVCSVLLLVFSRYWSECLHPCSPAELGFIDPHAMQDHGELAGECNLGKLGAAPFGNSHCPATQG